MLMSAARFCFLERRIKREPVLKKNYSEFLQEHLDLGHMSEAHTVTPWTPQVNTVQNFKTNLTKLTFAL